MRIMRSAMHRHCAPQLRELNPFPSNIGHGYPSSLVGPLEGTANADYGDCPELLPGE